jgi:hypothetical protein
MLPYPTDRRRLLLMVQVFLHEFTELVSAYEDGWSHRGDGSDPTADLPLESFLERLAVDAGQIDAAAVPGETAADIRRGIDRYVDHLLRQEEWHRRRISWN